MTGVLNQILVALLWGTVILRVPTLWRDARQRALWATLLLLALVKTAGLPEVSPPVKLPHLLGVATGFCLLRFISLITGRSGTRRQLVLAATVLVALVLLPNTNAGYWLVLNGYLGVVLTIATVLFWQAGRVAPAGLLRYGLYAMASGVATSALYALVKTSLIVAEALHAPVTFTAIQPAADAVRALGTILAVVGASVPAGSRLQTVAHAYRSLWRLRPLWRVMRRTFPEVILFSRRRALIELSGVEEVQLRLYRRVIEIRDGMLALRGYLPADALREASDFLGPASTPELVEACGIALALERHRRAAEVVESGARWADPGSGCLVSEIEWLSRVSTVFRQSEPVQFARSAQSSLR